MVAVPVVNAVARTGGGAASASIVIDTAVVARRAAAIALVVARLVCLHTCVSVASSSRFEWCGWCGSELTVIRTRLGFVVHG